MAAMLNAVDEAQAARTLIAEATPQARDVPVDFSTTLFARAAPEDVLRYRSQDLTVFAARAWTWLAQRRPGAASVRFEEVTLPADETAPAAAATTVGVIEIVNDDMPFLVDSVMNELAEQGLTVRLMAHPVLAMERDPNGRLTAFRGSAAGNGAARESFIHIHVDPVADAPRRAAVAGQLETVLGAVRVAVADWRAMQARVGETIAQLKDKPPPLPVAEISEAIQFIEWLLADNFTFIGVRDYALTDDGERVAPVAGSGLGVLRTEDMHVLRHGDRRLEMTPEIMAFLKEPRLLIVTKANTRSLVHRRVYLDYIGFKRFNADGRLAGELRIVGLFTSTAYTRSPRSIPYLRRKIAAIETRAGLLPDSHSGKALANVLETYPRDELFHIDEDTLYDFAMTMLRLDERPRLRVLVRRDRFDRFVSVLLFVPRERADSRLRTAVGNYLASMFDGRVSAFYPYYTEGPLVRVHFIIGRDGGRTPEVARATLESAIDAIIRNWSDSLSEVLTASHPPEKARALFDRYGAAFPASYRDDFQPADAVAGIAMLEKLTPERPLGVTFTHRDGGDRKSIDLRIWSAGRPLPLSERVPVLENMGFRVIDERTYRLAPEGRAGAWLHDMLLQSADGAPVDLDDPAQKLKPRLETAFLVVMGGTGENDGYNALVLSGGLMWRDVALLRIISRFLQQARVPFSQDYMWATLRKHHAIAADIVALFHARFDPRPPTAADRATTEQAIAARIEAALDKVQSLDEDRILRRFLNAVRAAVRTNFYQPGADGGPKPLIAIKFESRKLDELPKPHPLYEIFVSSPRVEGDHLRFGKVARGGIRWSDRPQDFRTEVLGLVKAQQVKNAVIVPVGSKGGFVPRQLAAVAAANPGKREAVQAEGTTAYRLFINAMLDITDNIGRDGRIVPPEHVVRHDGDDPYLVVAADKGTATFSDLANGISREHHFWLDDAFASGGSAGYDHKGMGITARGAWESVKRHFREMDINIHETPFTCVGVGDMSGDVFGNGMLREKTTKLIAAFDHRDIFIDPSPDPERSFAERKRLFELPRSSWQDFDKALISRGGGVFSRALKEIDLSPEARAALGFDRAKATPQQVMSAILRAPVDLLFFGGIGTYVRASSEGDEAAGDRANDAIRVSGKDLRCKVIGEGANLGMTQRGRVEAAMTGVRLNTDAIDNSAGVNTSDVEVNIKIALTRPMHDGRLTLATRNALLTEMTGEVARVVLRNNYLQTLALSLAERRGLEDAGFLQRLMQLLETQGHLDRAVEFLPDDAELADRFKRGTAFTRPELAVLLAYSKLRLYEELLDSPIPDDRYLGRELARYFPKEVAERYPDALDHHRLRREIIATQLANSMINRGGPSLIVRIADQTGAGAPRIASAFAAVRDSYEMTELNDAINALDNRIAGATQLDLYAAVQDLLLDRLVWFLRHVDLDQGLADIVTHYHQGISAVADTLAQALPQDMLKAVSARAAHLQNAGLERPLALRFASLPLLTSAPDIVLIGDRVKRPVAEVAATYFATQALFRVEQIVDASRAVPASDYFDRLAVDRSLDTIGDAARRLTAQMLRDGVAGGDAVTAWTQRHAHDVERTRASIDQIVASGLSLAKLSVAANLLGDLAKE
ncbi:MAG TPA: NAD-glutamate dehydrogenase [Pseudolabrys sp.]|nr:NAD-glutamate dehydrogenase [Pseudolabrys sp.]